MTEVGSWKSEAGSPESGTRSWEMLVPKGFY